MEQEKGNIRLATANIVDFSEILRVDTVVIGDDSRHNYLHEAIKENKCLILRDGAQMAGFLTYHTHFFENSFISLLIVHPAFRRKGYGSVLMRYFEKISPTEKVFSSTNQSNLKMQNLFAGLGYVKSGVVENLDEGDPEIFYFKKIDRSKL